MKEFEVYKIAGNEMFRLATFKTKTRLDAFLSSQDRYTFFLVRSLTVENKHARFTRTYLYLRGYRLHSSRREIIFADDDEIIEAKKRLNTIYCADGSTKFIPNIPITTPEVKQIIGGWFHLACVKDAPERFVICFFDDKATDNGALPPYNKAASERFGRDLYGDVMYINESLVS